MNIPVASDWQCVVLPTEGNSYITIAAVIFKQMYKLSIQAFTTSPLNRLQHFLGLGLGFFVF